MTPQPPARSPDPPINRSTGTDLYGRMRQQWSRLLEIVVHGGMVVGMVSFLAFDLVSASGRAPMAWANVATGILVAALTLLLRHIPLVGLLIVSTVSLAVTGLTLLLGIVGTVTPTVGFGEVAAISILSSEVARRSKPEHVAIGLAVAIVATGVSAAVRSPAYTGYIAVFWLVLTLAVVMGLALRWTERSRQLTTDAARREERLSIARELHDTVAHHVTGIVVQAQAARAVGADNPEAVERALANIETSGLATMNAMRRLVGALREDDADEAIAPTAGLADVARLVEQSRRDGFIIRLEMEMGGVPPSYGSSIYRIIQEALTNVRRHGRDVQEVTVTVRAEDDGIHVSVADDGKHHDHQGTGGFGLTGMAERVAALGGHFWAGARPDRGWGVTAWIPME